MSKWIISREPTLHFDVSRILETWKFPQRGVCPNTNMITEVFRISPLNFEP
jgi:hypothetical protein